MCLNKRATSEGMNFFKETKIIELNESCKLGTNTRKNNFFKK